MSKKLMKYYILNKYKKVLQIVVEGAKPNNLSHS